MTSLIVYFSRAGSNWVKDGIQNLEIGNTELLAKYLQQQTNGNIIKIETKNKYTNDYRKATEEAKYELENNIKPEIICEIKDFNKYDLIYLCHPVWWDTFPMAIRSFLEKYDFSNKTIIPFCTHEGSGIANCQNDLQQYCNAKNIKQYFETRGYLCQNIMNDKTLQDKINNFIKK